LQHSEITQEGSTGFTKENAFPKEIDLLFPNVFWGKISLKKENRIWHHQADVQEFEPKESPCVYDRIIICSLRLRLPHTNWKDLNLAF